jgi:hypothetical protein
MGEHDQTVLHDEDAHESIHNDGRSLRYIEYGAGAGAGADHDAYHHPDAYFDKSVFRYCNDKLIPDTVHVRIRPFTVTKWESIYSTVFGNGTQPGWDSPITDPGIAPSFEPVVDDRYLVIGHLGWISGTEICVPKGTIAWDSPVAHIFEARRLGEDRQRLLSLHDQDMSSRFSGRRAAPEPDTPLWAAIRRGQFKDESEERHQDNINFFLAGGGTALVGRDYIHDQMASQNFEPFLPGDYRCMVLVNPDGFLQGVLGVEKIHHESRKDMYARIALEIAFDVIDIAFNILMIIDIATISVVLFRVGRSLVGEIMIRALAVSVEREAKVAIESALRAARKELVGAMSGPEEAEAKTALEKFWHDGNVRPSKQLSENQVKKLNRKIAKRMDELGIPKKSQGAGQRITPPRGEKSPPGSGKKRPYWDENGKAFNETGNTRGANVRDIDMDRLGGIEGGISVHGNVFEPWEGFDLWNDPTTTVEDRIDAVIAHEWSEFNGLTHLETVELVPETKLAIRPRARELLREMVAKGNSEMVRTEFTKVEWNAIQAAGKENAPFKEKLAAVAAAKAR